MAKGSIMRDKIGKLYTEAEIAHAAKCRAVDDSKHDVVIWQCEKCLEVVETLVLQSITAKQCKCGTWMQWHYKAGQVA